MNRRVFILGGIFVSVIPTNNLFAQTKNQIDSQSILNHIKQQIEQTLDDNFGNINDQYTRQDIIFKLSTFLDVYVSNDLLYKYKVICNEKNNPPQYIDQGKLKVTVIVQFEQQMKPFEIEGEIKPNVYTTKI